MKLNEITVVLPTRNEEHNIVSFLDSLPTEVKLIVVDASDDATRQLVETCRPANTLVISCPGGITAARQLGAEAAETEWLLFSDADIVFADDYFEGLVLNDVTDVTYGPKLSKDAFQRHYRWVAWGQALCQRLRIPAASGSNLMVRRNALIKAGGFDLDLNCNEDSELVWRMKRRGFTTAFAGDLVVYATDHRRLHRGVMRKTLHSTLRCGLLYSGMLPRQWRRHDWGYWSEQEKHGRVLAPKGNQ